jgi:hypothetical protein
MKRFLLVPLALVLHLGSAADMKAGTFYEYATTPATYSSQANAQAAFTAGLPLGTTQLWMETFENSTTYNITNSGSGSTARAITQIAGMANSNYQAQVFSGGADSIIGTLNHVLLTNNTTTGNPVTIEGTPSSSQSPPASLVNVGALSFDFGSNNTTGTWAVHLTDGTSETGPTYSFTGSQSGAPYFFGYIASPGEKVAYVTFSDENITVLDNITAYGPEPSCITLLGIGIATIAGFGWRRKTKQSVA